MPEPIFPYKLIIHPKTSNREPNKMAFGSSRQPSTRKIDKFFTFIHRISFFFHFISLFVVDSIYNDMYMQGQFFSGSAYRIYLLGNPIIWWSNLIFLTIFVLEFLVSAVKQQRGYKNNLENNGNVTITTTPRHGEYERQRVERTKIRANAQTQWTCNANRDRGGRKKESITEQK